MKEKLKQLLMIPEGFLSGVTKKCDSIDLINKVNMDFHYIQFQDGNIRIMDFISILESGIISYCHKREEAKETNHLTGAIRTKEAKETFVRGESSGEIGELALYMFLESFLCAPQILSKMSIKTSGNLHYNGSDAVHMKIDDLGNIIFFLGESKIYKSLSGSINACMQSIHDFYFDELVEGRAQFDFDMRLVRTNMDIEDPELKQLVKDLLNPWSGGKENLQYINACFIAFQVNSLQEQLGSVEPAEREKALIDIYKEKIEEIVGVVDKVILKKNVQNLRFHFFFMPVSDVGDLKSEFRKMLGFESGEV